MFQLISNKLASMTLLSVEAIVLFIAVSLRHIWRKLSANDTFENSNNDIEKFTNQSDFLITSIVNCSEDKVKSILEKRGFIVDSILPMDVNSNEVSNHNNNNKIKTLLDCSIHLSLIF
jgi:hypothetical protein